MAVAGAIGVITSAELADNAVTTDKLINDAVTNPKILDETITDAKLDNPKRTNLIINGDMRIAQRDTSVTGKTSSGYFTVDRWLMDIGTAGTWTISQSTDVPSGQGFGYSTKWDCTTANASLSAGSFMSHQQRFEGQELQRLKKGTSNAETTTISFWVKSNKTGTYIVEIEDRDNTRHISQSYTIDSADTWEKKTLTFAGDTTGAFDNDTAASVHLFFWLVAGTNYSSGTLATSWAAKTNANRAVGQVNLADSTSNEFYITGIQWELGSTASDFEHEDLYQQKLKCYRYYYQSDGSSAEFKIHGSGTIFQTTNADICMDLPVQTRSVPTVATANTAIQAGATTYAVTGISEVSGTDGGLDRLFLRCATGGTMTVAQGCILTNNNNAGGKITVSSEL